MAGFLKRLFSKKTTPQHENSHQSTQKDEGENRKYHVSLNKDQSSDHFNLWRVRKASSNKTIKYFKTQQEAIDYAEKLATANNTSIVIHKKDGSIRKQNY